MFSVRLINRLMRYRPYVITAQLRSSWSYVRGVWWRWLLGELMICVRWWSVILTICDYLLERKTTKNCHQVVAGLSSADGLTIYYLPPQTSLLSNCISPRQLVSHLSSPSSHQIFWAPLSPVMFEAPRPDIWSM